MRILYVTSFTAEMYPRTGVHLVRSFLETDSDGALLICHEGGFAEPITSDTRRLEQYDLDTSAFLRDWLRANRDIIPSSLGGAATGCACDRLASGSIAHRTGCVFGWFNKQASRWFRKIVSLDYAISHVPHDVLVWIDCDCRFTRALPSSVFARLLENASVLYHKSPEREVIESGVIAFKRDAGGDKVLTTTIERFRSGAFRRDVRWDDGYQFQIAIESCRDVPSKDLGRCAPNLHVLPSSPLGAYIQHGKGTHTALGLMA
jgi:hypothetical protein